MWRAFFICFALVLSGRLSAEIQLSEFMIDPPGSENSDEYVELYNYSKNEIDLSACLFGDGSDMDEIIAVRGGQVIGAGEYAVILDPDHGTVWSEQIPDTVSVYTIEDSRFGAYGLSNSSTKTYYIYRSDGLCADSLQISDAPDEGFSLERVDPGGNEWRSGMEKGGTPGYRNSVSPAEWDIAVSRMLLSQMQDKIQLQIKLKNLGLQRLSSLDLHVITGSSPVSDSSGERYFSSDSLIISSLPSGDSTIFLLDVVPKWFGMHYMQCSVMTESDTRLLNNTRLDSIFFLPEADSAVVLLNEFCPVPGDVHGCEYSEFYFHFLSRPFNLRGLKYADLVKDSRVQGNGFADAGDLILISADDILTKAFPGSAPIIPPDWPSQNNSGDRIALQGPGAEVICEFNYDSNFPLEHDRAVELINPSLPNTDPENWTSVQKGSPGQVNYAIAPEKLLEISAVTMQNGPSPGYSIISVEISNKGRAGNVIQYLNILADLNLNGTISDHELLDRMDLNEEIAPGEMKSIEFPLMTDLEGAYPGLIRISGTVSYRDTLIFPYRRSSIRLNEIMPSPLSGAKEWLEIYNEGENSVNLMTWALSDPGKKVFLPDSIMVLSPGRYALISGDNDVLHDYPVDRNSLFIEMAIPNLNSQSDELWLFGSDGSTMDSMSYGQSRRPDKGISLEYLQHIGWLPSLDSLGASPGRKNSQLINMYHFCISQLSIGTLNYLLKNSGYLQQTGLEYYIFLDGKQVDSGRIDLMRARDSLLIKEQWPLNSPPGWQDVIFVTRSNEYFQTDTFRNFKSYDNSPVNLNEVLFIADSDEDKDEFIELYSSTPDLDLQGYSLTVGEKRVFLKGTPPSGYTVLSSGQSYRLNANGDLLTGDLPSLKNSGDRIGFYDPAGAVIDSADLAGHQDLLKGISLEKNRQGVSFSSHQGWGACLKKCGHSAGEKNSRYSTAEKNSQLVITPRHFDPEGEHINILFSLSSENGISYAELRIFDLRGRRLHKEKQDNFDSPEILMTWNARSGSGLRASPGLYLSVMIYKDINNKRHFARGSFTILR